MKVGLATLLGVAFLFVFFRAIRMKWPESYFGATTTSVYAISVSPVRYGFFRLAPVYITCVFVAVSLDRAHSNGFLGAALVGVFHALLSAGISLVGLLRLPGRVRRRRIAIALMYSVVFVAVLLTAFAAGATANLWRPLIPGAGDLAATLWTALLAGVVGASRHQVDSTEVLRRSIRGIPRGMWQLAATQAAAKGADPVLVRSVMAAENVERPAWFRRLERIKALVVPEGTYGIMQVHSGTPLSDEESVGRAVERMVGVDVRDEEGYLDADALRSFAKQWNPDPAFGELLADAYNEVSEGMGGN